ncbi:MAG TPA: site-specific integrase [Methylotenera sp.]
MNKNKYVTRRGKDKWQVSIRIKGDTPVYRTFNNKAEADKFAKITVGEMLAGKKINSIEATRTTLSEIINKYKVSVLPTLKAKSQQLSRLRIIEEKLGDRFLVKITADEIIKFRNDRSKTLADNSVNREVSTLKSLLAYANDACNIILPNGVPKVKKLKIDDSRSRRITDDEILAILKHVGQTKELIPIVKFALFTAARRGEIANLKKSDVNLKIPNVTFVNTKNNSENRTIPLASLALELIRDLLVNSTKKRRLQKSKIDGKPVKNENDVYVFALSASGISQAFERARKRARKHYEQECVSNGMDPDKDFLIDLRFHDLRHEATSRLATVMHNIIELSKITGHSDPKTVSRYYNMTHEELVSKMNNLSFSGLQ